MITTIFNKTALLLVKTAQKVNLTYNEVNIIVYYMIVPLTWCIMLDLIFSSWPWMSVVWLALCVAVIWWHRKDFSTWCDWAFEKSVNFLLWFRRIGWNYYKASVIICVVLPIAIFILITLLAI
ncbi:MAG: hypothetical protein J5980_03910 [Muribaculaceae bacterium]|nr:hypothetical protein [Muribaculaceae bacterium]